VFTLSAKAVYGLTAVTELAVRYRTGAVQIRDIAEQHDIPQQYLEQILVTLKRAGFIESFRGAQGGYALSRPPDQIRLGELLATLEGRLEVVPENHENNALSFFWQELHAGLSALLNRTLQDLITAKQHSETRYTYSI